MVSIALYMLCKKIGFLEYFTQHTIRHLRLCCKDLKSGVEKNCLDPRIQQSDFSFLRPIFQGKLKFVSKTTDALNRKFIHEISEAKMAIKHTVKRTHEAKETKRRKDHCLETTVYKQKQQQLIM